MTRSRIFAAIQSGTQTTTAIARLLDLPIDTVCDHVNALRTHGKVRRTAESADKPTARYEAVPGAVARKARMSKAAALLLASCWKEPRT